MIETIKFRKIVFEIQSDRISGSTSSKSLLAVSVWSIVLSLSWMQADKFERALSNFGGYRTNTRNYYMFVGDEKNYLRID